MSRASQVGHMMAQVVFAETGCWLWSGVLRKGYPRFGPRHAHRLMYELLVGPIPDGLELDHVCRTPACIFPDHLEPVTRGENIRRRSAVQTHCRNGHEFTPANTRYTDGRRYCRACQRRRSAEYKARKMAEALS